VTRESDANLLGQQVLDVMDGLTEEEVRERRRKTEDDAAAVVVRLILAHVPAAHVYGWHHREWSGEITVDGVAVTVRVAPPGAG